MGRKWGKIAGAAGQELGCSAEAFEGRRHILLWCHCCRKEAHWGERQVPLSAKEEKGVFLGEFPW